MRICNRLLGSIFGLVVAFAGSTAWAGSHNWWINELFSNADGTIQFIELQECCGTSSEWGLGGKWVLSDTTSNQFNFPGNIAGDTANKHLLLATAGFAALPGAPTPDYIIPDNFFDLNADILTYWLYGPPTMSFGAGDLPTDGILSLNRDLSTRINSPTNYNDETGSVDASGGDPVPTVSEWGIICMLVLSLTAGTILLVRQGKTTAVSN